MKKHVLSALLLAGALVVAPLGNIFSVVATASSNNVPWIYPGINAYFPAISSGRMTVAEVLQTISTWYSAEELQAAAECHSDVAAQFEQLKMMYEEENAANPIQVSQEISSDVQDKIATASVEGAQLNAAAGSAVTLRITSPAQLVQLGSSKNFQVEINLDGVADSHNLRFPVRITISVPVGFDAGNMHILHYGDGIDAAPENVPFTVNGDGTISFSATSFSLFAFVEGQYVAPDNGENNNENNNETNTADEEDDEDDSEDDSSDDSQNTVAAPAQGVKDSVPKTGDSNVPVLPFAVAGVACAVAACALMKKEQA